MTYIPAPEDFWEAVEKHLGRDAINTPWYTERFEGVGDEDGDSMVFDRSGIRQQLIAECLGLTDPC